VELLEDYLVARHLVFVCTNMNYYPSGTPGSSQGNYQATLNYYRDYYTSLGYDPASAHAYAVQYANAQYQQPSSYYQQTSAIPSAVASADAKAAPSTSQPTAAKPSYAAVASATSSDKPAYIPVNIKTKTLPTASAPSSTVISTPSTPAGPAGWPDDLK
jgi:hypothetical protein